LGALDTAERVWVPRQEEREDACEWVDFTPWESRFGGFAYEQFITGVYPTSTGPVA